MASHWEFFFVVFVVVFSLRVTFLRLVVIWWLIGVVDGIGAVCCEVVVVVVGVVRLVWWLVRVVDGIGAVCCVAVGVVVVVFGCWVVGGVVGVVVDVSLGSAVACEVGVEGEVVA